MAIRAASLGGHPKPAIRSRIAREYGEARASDRDRIKRKRIDRRGKAGHVRTVPVPNRVLGLIDDWMQAVRNHPVVAASERLVCRLVKEFAAKVLAKTLTGQR
jgi:hypothetical protein